ncbi:response regulator [Phenylobacterium sp.]|jgi:CheY-like chemotaxis protein|uniref:response regulator n=1 Tax=Phenylobacterium sp. TaxID=1871053 RepID=UPI0025E2AC14|nr:response regulator [Phenylobacterium sp.]MCA3721739.1 response regulator [Phenylobacterium sp.]
MNRSARINLSSANVLVVDDNLHAVELLCGVLDGFGMRRFKRATSIDEAKEACEDSVFDLILTDAQSPGVDGYELIQWVRRSQDEQVRLTPAIIITAHTRRSQVAKARDCGANYIIAKPITPKIILERIIWVAQSTRMFLETESYIGPDRRVRKLGPPTETGAGRRKEDADAAAAAEADAEDADQEATA